MLVPRLNFQVVNFYSLQVSFFLKSLSLSLMIGAGAQLSILMIASQVPKIIKNQVVLEPKKVTLNELINEHVKIIYDSFKNVNLLSIR